MPYLTIYDITGIQDYIFSSNKLKENIGASNIVDLVFSRFLPEKIKEVIPVALTEWKDKEKFAMLDDSTIKAEIVYIGGGNAVVAYQKEEDFIEVNKKLSLKLLELTENQLGFAFASIPTDFTNYHRDKKELFAELRKNKNSQIRSLPLLGLNITRQGITDNLPATDKVNDDYLSLSACNKREDEYSNKITQITLPNGYIFNDEFENLGQIEGENHIAVVHIDGNNMGIQLNQLLEGTNYLQAVNLMRRFATEVDSVFKNTFSTMIDNFLNLYKTDQSLQSRIEQKMDKKSNCKILPLRPIVLNGDDVTFVCDGRLGINLAKIFLKKLPKTIGIYNNKNINLSACAGVSVVKTKFPFYRAYELAEELCSSAKKKGKFLAKENGTECGSWLDFHISQSGLTSDLETIRKSSYNIPGADKADVYSGKDGVFPQYNLLWRPWQIKAPQNSIYNFDEFNRIFGELNNNWARSSLKQLRNAYIHSEEDVLLVVEEKNSREKKLPKFKGQKEDKRCYAVNFIDENGTEHNQTPYFDILETLDFYFATEV